MSRQPMLSLLNGIVPQETLLSMIPAVKDVEEAAQKLSEEQGEAFKRQQEMMMNTPLTGGDDE